MSSPKLRFKGFSDEWKKEKLKNVSMITTGSTPSTFVTEYYDGEKLFVSPSDIQGNRFVTTTKTTLTNLGFSKGRKINKGSILFVCIGSTIGKIAIAGSECITNQQINAVEAKVNYNNSFLYNVLELNSKKIKLLAGVQAVPQINKTDFSNFSFKFPTLTEQKKIATFFTTIDQKLNLLKEKKEKLELYKKGVMQQIFSQKLRFRDTSTTLSGSEGNEFPNWEGKKLGAVLTIGSGRDYKHLKKGNVPVYGTGGLMLYVDDFLYDGESVGIGRKGTINKPVFLENKFWTVDTLFYTHSFKNCIPKFIYFTFLTINWLQYNEAGGVPSLSKSTIDQIQIQIPSLPEQEKIAQFLSTLDAKINLVETQIQKTELWKKGLLQQMFV